MSKPKYASLTAGLLARKGEAAPASHGFAVVPGLARAPESRKRRFVQERRDCLEALPHDEAAPAAGALPNGRHFVTYESHGSAPHTVAVHLPHYDPTKPKRRTAVTVRLDESRYLRLKLTGARLHRTNQDLLTAALDSYLAALGVDDIEAAVLPAKD